MFLFSRLLGWVFLVLAVFVCIIVIIRGFFYEPFTVPSGSMLPTLGHDGVILADKSIYGYSPYGLAFNYKLWSHKKFSAPVKRGDIIIFALPSNTDVDYIKRVVGLPNDQIQVLNGRLFINRIIIDRKFVRTIEYLGYKGESVTVDEYSEILPNGKTYNIFEKSDDEFMDNTELFTVPKAHYFVMGDNRDLSQDSRSMSSVGFVPDDNVKGRASILIKDGEKQKLVFKLIEPDTSEK